MQGNGSPFGFQAIGQQTYNVRAITTTATATAGDQVIYASTAGGDYTLTLPDPAALKGQFLYVTKTTTDFNVLTISSISTTLNTNGESVLLVVNASGAWTIVERRIPSTWTSFTPTGSWSTNTTYTGFWKRFGDSIRIRIYIVLGGAPDAVTLTLNLVGSLSIDTAKLTSTGGNDGILGTVLLTDTGTAKYTGAVVYSSGTAVQPRYFDNSNPVRALAINATAPVAWASTDTMSFVFEVPITGWNG